MVELNKALILAMYSETELRIQTQEAVLRRQHNEASSLAQQISATNRALHSLKLQQLILHEALIIERGIPEKVARLRSTILEKMEKVLRKDILVKTRENLEKEIKALKIELQSICGHPFIMKTQISYEGSSSMDYEDNHPGTHLCIVCGKIEDSVKTVEVDFLEKKDLFPTLNEADSRIIKWAGAVGWKVEPYRWTNADPVLQPLEKLVEKYFIDKRLRHIIDNDQHLNLSATQQNK